MKLENSNELAQKPDFRIVKDTYLTDDGCEMTMGFYIADVLNKQVWPASHLTSLSIDDAKEKLAELMENKKSGDFVPNSKGKAA